MSRLLLTVGLLLASTFATDAVGQTIGSTKLEAAKIEFFESKIRPVLVRHCYKCHSADTKKLKGGLLLDDREGLLTGGESGPAVVPGDVSESLLLSALRHEDFEMPPEGKLPAQVIADFEAWVKMGAPDPRDAKATTDSTDDRSAGDSKSATQIATREFWSFQPITNPEPPATQNTAWPQGPIDRFVLARLEEKNLHPVAAADRRTLIRRATFDLIGLPPTPEEVEAFLQDRSPAAFAKVVDRLLDSPHYGERWARHWLDVARYGEDQAHSFKPRQYASGFRYRDWLVTSLNDDMPYDEFIQSQIAGDLLDGPGKMQRAAALGFFAIGPVYYGDAEKFDQLDDRVDTLTRGVLGLTVSCARCHDHKYDPIPTADYYSLAGVFASSQYVETPLVEPQVVAAYRQGQKAIKTHKKMLEALLTAEAKRLKVPKGKVEAMLSENEKEVVARDKLAAMRQEMDRLRKTAPAVFAVAHSLKDRDKPRNLPILNRGDPKAKGEQVPRHFLSVLSGDDPPPFTQGSGRLELARAIASADNPLTARVIVNRLWHHHFGRGLVGSLSNFGNQGDRPTHPKLLDHLASRLIAQGWSLKKLHREIMLSATYQLGSTSKEDKEDNETLDPENRLLWRANRRRVDVEAWRDAMLAVSGTLDKSMGGPSLNLADGNNRRRTVYGKVSRHDLNSLLRLFDFPDPNITAGARSVTTVPLQQLFVLNSPFMLSQARALAGRVGQDVGGGVSDANSDNNAERIGRAIQLAYGRPATETEISQAIAFLGSAESTDRLTAWQQYAQILLATNEFMYLD